MTEPTVLCGNSSFVGNPHLMDDETCCFCGSATGSVSVIHTDGLNYCSFDCVVKALTPEQRSRVAKLMGPIGKQPKRKT